MVPSQRPPDLRKGQLANRSKTQRDVQPPGLHLIQLRNRLNSMWWKHLAFVYQTKIYPSHIGSKGPFRITIHAVLWPGIRNCASKLGLPKMADPHYQDPHYHRVLQNRGMCRNHLACVYQAQRNPSRIGSKRPFRITIFAVKMPVMLLCAEKPGRPRLMADHWVLYVQPPLLPRCSMPIRTLGRVFLMRRNPSQAISHRHSRTSIVAAYWTLAIRKNACLWGLLWMLNLMCQLQCHPLFFMFRNHLASV
mmetsp:Transcript_33536/g.60410  ORF Transcript_33536/g.60410 Transcript_33536/m.60410 type:complete len:249 (+) Transcript_33536:1534-2280(+)